MEFTCGFAVFSDAELKCYIGPNGNGGTNMFSLFDQAFIRRGNVVLVFLKIPPAPFYIMILTL